MRKFLFCFVVIICLILVNNHFYFFAINVYEPSDEGSFRIMTYNTNGIHWNHDDAEFGTDFLDAIDSIHPQILVLQELRTNYSDSVCTELKNRYPYNSLVELSKLKRGDKNVACLFSQYPIKSFFRYRFDKYEIDSIYKECAVPDSVRRPTKTDIYDAVVVIDGRETLVVCCYLRSNEYSKLRHLYSGRWYDGFNDYFEGYNKGSAVRSLNAKMIRDSIAKYDLPTIVCGDMNDFQCSQTLQKIMSDDMKNVWWERGFGYGMTYNNYNLKIRIDHVLISNKIQAVRVDVPHFRFSDHYPIVADLKFNSN